MNYLIVNYDFLHVKSNGIINFKATIVIIPQGYMYIMSQLLCVI